MMQQHQIRATQEYNELEDRISRLSTFLNSPRALAVEQAERTLMVSQLASMRAYSAFLSARIRLWQS